MIPTTHSRRQTGHLSPVCLVTVALVVGMSLPGCVKSPRELLTSLRPQKADVETAESEEENAAIADAAETDSDLKTAQVSRSETDGKLAKEEADNRNLFDRLMNRQHDNPDGASTDPFIESDAAASKAKQEADELAAKTETEVKRRAATLEELLAQSKPSTSNKPDTSTSSRKDKNSFASGFDTRLERLKADLERKPDTSKDDAAGDVNPFADFVAKSPPKNADTIGTVSSVSFEQKLDRSLVDDRAINSGTSAAKERVQTLLQQAHEDWDSWKLEEAYRKALAAQELAVLENVQFDVADERPGDLAKRIASDIRKDSFTSTTTTKTNPWADESTSHDDVLGNSTSRDDDAFGRAASRAFSSFTAGTSTVGWQAAVSEHSTRPSLPQAGVDSPDADSSTTGRSGVNLLPPSDDDFPSEAEGIPWQGSASAKTTNTRTVSASTNSVVNLAWPEDAKSARNKDEGPANEGPALVRYDSDAYTPTSQAVNEDSKALWSQASANHDRVFPPAQAQWPSLPAPETSTANQRRDQSEQVAVAAPILLGVNDAPVASAHKTTAPTTVSTIHATDAPAARSWFSRPMWFVGGLVLLMLAMRLLSRRSGTVG